MVEKIIAQAAEAIIIQKKGKIIKRRIKKGYRIPEIDEKLRKLRTRQEAKLLEKASKIIHVPKILKVDEGNKEIEMEFIDGKKLADSLDSLKNRLEVAKQIGQEVGKLHDLGIIHGDLTTSNMILKNNHVYFIDFGLGFQNPRIEDKAVDLHLLKQALEAKHFKYNKELFQAVLKGYNPEDKTQILTQLEKVETRGRYKH